MCAAEADGPRPARLWQRLASGSGPAVARAFGAALALVFLVAFVSLGVQLDVLIGSRGLLPAGDFLDSLRERGGIGFAELPSVFWWGAGDAALRAGAWLGAALAVLALFGLAPRVLFPLQAALYLSYVVVGRSFLSFQWDNLLIECGLLAAFLPRDRAAPWAHALFRLLLFKLYFESGVAKWQSSLGDWHDGSAMTFYYETAPLPAALGWLAHSLPDWWHHLESRATLALELIVPFAVFGPRRVRLFGCVLLTGFQIVNLATANYGFFVWLALGLHLFMLDDRDLERVLAALRRFRPSWARRGLRRPRLPALLSRSHGWVRARRVIAPLALVLLLTGWVVEALAVFGPPGARDATLGLRRVWAPWHFVNTYHLFGHITRERVEPSFETLASGTWTEHPLHYKPGPVERPPPYIAPHQPRVDFLLWFYGLRWRRSPPEYVGRLLSRICHDPDAVQALFATALPPDPDEVRIRFWRYRMSEPGTPENWWRRAHAGDLGPLRCGRLAR